MCEGCAEDMYIKQLPQLMLSGGSISSLAWGTGQELPEGLEEPVSVSVPSSPFFAVLIKCAPKPCPIGKTPLGFRVSGFVTALRMGPGSNTSLACGCLRGTIEVERSGVDVMILRCLIV